MTGKVVLGKLRGHSLGRVTVEPWSQLLSLGCYMENLIPKCFREELEGR